LYARKISEKVAELDRKKCPEKQGYSSEQNQSFSRAKPEISGRRFESDDEAAEVVALAAIGVTVSAEDDGE